MPTSTWREVERWYATDLGGKRVHSGDKKDERDVVAPGLSVEVKHRKTAIPAAVRSAVEQIERNARRNTLPFVIAHTPGTLRENAVVYMRYKDFKRLLRRAGLGKADAVQ